MDSDIPLKEISTASGASSTGPSGIYNPSHDGSKATSQRPLRPVRFQDGDLNDQEVDSKLGKNLESRSEYTAFTENTIVPRRNLGFVQVTSLMLNGCLGNPFFFSTPGYVLALVRSKRISLVLYAVGAIYSALGMTVFLEYGIALPFNGGPLIYLDEVFHTPKLLATLIFALWWILFASTVSSAKSVAQSILSLASHKSAFEIEDGWIQFTSVVVQTVVCLMLYFAPRHCFALNSVSALYKIILMFVIFVAGIAASRGSDSGFNDFNVEYPGYNSKEVLTALVYVFQSFQGWDNANYVSGQVNDYKGTLKWAGITCIAILTCLNMLFTLAVFGIADYYTLTNEEGQANSGLQFAQLVFGSTRGLEAATGLSMFGSLIFVTYTTAKVKQAIAWQRIIPFSSFFGRQDAQFDSPGGGLFLHWIFTVIPILCLGKFTSDPRRFYSGMFSYGYEILTVFMGLGLFRLKGRMRLYQNNWNHVYLNNRYLLIFVAVSFVALNLLTMVMTALPKDPGRTPRFYWPVALACLIALSTVYWAVLRFFQVNDPKRKSAMAESIGFKVYVYEDGDDVPDEMKFPMYEASLDGTRRRLDYELTGPLAWCTATFRRLKAILLRPLAY